MPGGSEEVVVLGGMEVGYVLRRCEEDETMSAPLVFGFDGGGGGCRSEEFGVDDAGDGAALFPQLREEGSVLGVLIGVSALHGSVAQLRRRRGVSIVVVGAGCGGIMKGFVRSGRHGIGEFHSDISAGRINEFRGRHGFGGFVTGISGSHGSQAGESVIGSHGCRPPRNRSSVQFDDPAIGLFVMPHGSGSFVRPAPGTRSAADAGAASIDRHGTICIPRQRRPRRPPPGPRLQFPQRRRLHRVPRTPHGRHGRVDHEGLIGGMVSVPPQDQFFLLMIRQSRVIHGGGIADGAVQFPEAGAENGRIGGGSVGCISGSAIVADPRHSRSPGQIGRSPYLLFPFVLLQILRIFQNGHLTLGQITLLTNLFFQGRQPVFHPNVSFPSGSSSLAPGMRLSFVLFEIVRKETDEMNGNHALVRQSHAEVFHRLDDVPLHRSVVFRGGSSSDAAAEIVVQQPVVQRRHHDHRGRQRPRVFLQPSRREDPLRGPIVGLNPGRVVVIVEVIVGLLLEANVVEFARGAFGGGEGVPARYRHEAGFAGEEVG